MEALVDQRQKQYGSVTRDEFDSYYEGMTTGVALFFSQVWHLAEPVDLDDLRESVGFHPPQGFRYMTASELASPQLSRLVCQVSAATACLDVTCGTQDLAVSSG